MKRTLLISLAAALLGLVAACQPAPSPTPFPTIQPVTATPRPSPTPLPFEMFCTLVSQPPQANPQDSLFPPPSAQDWSRGPERAAFSLIEYADLRSPDTAQVAAVLEKLARDYPAQFRLVFRFLPDPSEPRSLLAAQAAQAAGLQQAFWEMQHLLLFQQADWLDLDMPALQAWLVEQAGLLGLDVSRFNTDLLSAEVIQVIQQSQQQASALGIPAPMLLLANGQIYQGMADYTSLETLLRLFDFQASQFSQCPPTVIDVSKHYLAVLETDHGRVVLELLPKQSPLAVNSFVFLARQGWYDDTTFHYVLPGLLVQGGDPSGTGFGNAGYAFSNEMSPDLTFDQPGMLAMANGSNSNSSQFFINLAPQPDWNGRYTIFGRVLEGLDVLESLSPRDPAAQFNPPPGERLLRITIEESDW